MTDEEIHSVIPPAWELLLESNPVVASTAAVAFILASVRQPEAASDVLLKELSHDSAVIRSQAIQR